jgi:hypothetical protein
LDTDLTATPPPVIPGWKVLRYGDHALPDGPVLAWFPTKDWDGGPWYYVPDAIPPLSVQLAPPVPDAARQIALVAAPDHPGMDLEPVDEAVARAQAYYDFLTTTTP